MNPIAPIAESSPRASIQEIFLAARAITDVEQRDQYLIDVVGDDHDLRRRVERMLVSQQDAQPGPLTRALEHLDLTVFDSANHSSIDVREHPQIGPYKILDRLGTGGMGEVFVAEQRRPVQRTVALKLIRRGMDSNDVIARFEAERQALAMMSHPNIARVLDAGQTEDGRPYFVMDLVRGFPITHYCDTHKLDLRERLKIFVTVCQAVQHAHQKGIIHRDLKPGNILVELDDVRHVPKVIDFGVAKATHQRLTERTLFTQMSQMIGTPLYMSPEQAQLNSLDVDTRSDVYSLGVVLYELLTGSTPFDKDTLTKAGYDEMRRIIREDEPPRPSHRISTLKAERLSTLVELEQKTAPQLERQVERELDWIVMKALEKDRVRRYESASAMGADIQRYLDGDLVQACPPSAGYRLQKYAVRHKGLLTTAALLAATLFVATGVSVAYAFQADQAMSDAKQQSAEAVAAKQLANQRLAQSRLDFDRALKALDTVVEQLSSAEFAQIPGVAKTRSEMLKRMITLYEEIASEHGGDPYARQQQALAYGRISDILGLTDQTEEAETTVNQGIAILEELLKADPNDSGHKLSMAELLFKRFHLSVRSRGEKLADAERALLLRQELVASGSNDHIGELGLASYKVASLLPEDSPRAAQLIAESIRVPEEHGLTPHPASYEWLAVNAKNKGNVAEAQMNYRRAIEGYQSFAEFGDRVAHGLVRHNCSMLAKLLNSLGRSDEAKAFHLQAIDIARQLYEEYGKIPAYEEWLGRSVQTYLTDATTEPQKVEALKLIDELVAMWPDAVTAQEYAQQAARHQQIDQFPQAAADYEKAVELEPNNHRWHYALAFFLNHVLHPAFRDYDRALKHAEKAVELKPGDVSSLVLLADIYHGRFNDTTQALTHLKTAVELAPSNRRIFLSRAKIHESNGDYVQAMADVNKAIQLDATTWCYMERARVHTALKHRDLAIADYSLAEEADRENSYVYDERASIYVSQERYSEALVDLNKSLQIVPFKSWNYKHRGLVHFYLVQYEQALADIAKALELNPTDLSCLTWIDTELVANCPNKEFRMGMRALADRGVALNDHSVASLAGRAQLLIAFGEWEQAREDLDALVAAEDATYDHLYQASLLSVAGQDMPRYEELCLKMLAAFADSNFPIETYFTAWTCALAPESIEDYAPAIKLARHAVEKEPGKQQYLTGLGAILMRLGQFDDAKLELEKALAADDTRQTSQSYIRYFLAMTEHHLGNEQAAQEQLQAANKSAEAELGETPPWNRKLMLELLRNEAAALIEP